MVYILLLFLLIFIFLILRFSLFIPATKGLPVLMYHKISETEKDGLTVTTEQFENQLKYLQTLDYQAVTTKNIIDFIEKKTALPPNPVLISFDDGYVNNLELAYPLLQKYNFRATIFLPTAFIGKTSSWDSNDSPILSLEQLKSFDINLIEFALHSHNHCNFKHLNLEEMQHEILENMQFLNENNLPFSPVFAYPYGGRPKDKNLLFSMKKILEETGIKIAFRIGNRVNKLPLKDVFEVNRIDIRGTDSFWEFKTKLKKGRVKQL